MSDTFEIPFVPMQEIKRVQDLNIDELDKMPIITEIARLNTLSMIKKAGSGHIGTSFSALDIFTFLYFHEMNLSECGVDGDDRDIFFSSKGHDVPGYYAVLIAAGIIPYDKITTLRRLGGLDGHPDVRINGVEANTGSLGMGISKAKGMAMAKRLRNQKGRVIVMTGDGELQEGQFWESIQATTHQKEHNIITVVDCNKIQSDKYVKDILDLGDLEAKLESFGWFVRRCDGHDHQALKKVFDEFKEVNDQPKILIADTIKGKGVSFMEGPTALSNDEIYRYHSGAPSDEEYIKGRDEICAKINTYFEANGLGEVTLDVAENRAMASTNAPAPERVVNAFSEELVELGKKHDHLVAMVADLSDDCGIRPFEKAFPERSVENGIAEQDMVSMAGGLALHGYLPVVNSFGVFLAARANEQIYNNATEETKVIYVCHYAGLIPAGPGHTHQSLRDISLFGALPDNCHIVEPCNEQETKALLKWCVEEAKTSCLLRMILVPSPGKITLPSDYALEFGKGTILREGTDAVIISYGPIMLDEALKAADLAEAQGLSIKVINMPWLNHYDLPWLEGAIGECKQVFVVDNHSPYGGLGDSMLNAASESVKLADANIKKFAVENLPACGTPEEVLGAHKLDAKSLVERISDSIKLVSA